MSQTDSPIEVSANAIPGQVKTAARQLVGYAAAYMIGRGWVDAQVINILLPVAPLVGVFLWGQYATWAKHRNTVTIASAAPDQVAVVK